MTILIIKILHETKVKQNKSKSLKINKSDTFEGLPKPPKSVPRNITKTKYRINKTFFCDPIQDAQII